MVQGGLFSAVGGSAGSWAVLRYLRPCSCLWWRGLPVVSGSLGVLLFGSKGSIWGPLPSYAAMCTQLSSRCGLGSSVLWGSSRCLGLLGLFLSEGAVITKIVGLCIHPGATFFVCFFLQVQHLEAHRAFSLVLCPLILFISCISPPFLSFSFSCACQPWQCCIRHVLM